MTDEQKRKKAQRERERRARIKEQQQAKQESPAEPAIQPEPPKDWDLTYSGAPAVLEPTQLDRIEALLTELVESNRRLHPNISELLNSGIKH